MGKKVNRVRYELDSAGVKSLPMDEIKTILRGADELILSGGRAMLAKILAGSKDKKLLELELNHCPVYGAFKGTTQKEILAKIDWMILNHYLEIEYDFRLPLLVFTDKGWEIERDTYAEELLEKLIEAAKNKRYEFVETLKDRNRGMILLLLDKIAESNNKELIIILKAWKMIDYNKVRTRIQEVIEVLEKAEEEIQMNMDKDAISFAANKKWLSIPKDIRSELERNVWCTTCGDVVQIEKYMVKEAQFGIVLQGKCKICGHEVARVID
ncbi:RQC-minor-1 family DNA-binding protein [Niallia sp. 01092]|uniref:RQC-minor-1 family DNA-binding protein n=1 Tax=unclassified Niallia TaxID=2837522 RepID=UPI003FD08D7A